MENKRKNKRREANLDLSTIVYGRVPPQAKDLEEAILGAIMLEREAFDISISILKKPECFYVDGHQRIFRAMLTLANQSSPIDILTVVEELRRTEELDLVGGSYYVTKLTNAVVSAGNIEAHCQILFQKFLLREQIRVCGEGLYAAYEDSTDAFDALDSLSSKITNLAMVKSLPSKDLLTIGVDRLRYYHEMSAREGTLIGVPTGSRYLDTITHGWINGDLIILAARPSIGKTALALNLAINAAKSGVFSAFFCLEMSEEKLFDRIISAEADIDLEIITKAKFSEEELRVVYKATQSITKIPLRLIGRFSLTILDLRAEARKLKKEHGLGLLIVDYLQLMSGTRDDYSGSNREQEIASISRGLKSLAQELHIPIIALSQMSREVEKTGKVKLSDLRESGAIEQDADVVAFLTREDYQQSEIDKDPALAGKATIDFKKNRQGKLERVPMHTVLEVQRWMDPRQYEQYMRNKQMAERLGSNFRVIKNVVEQEKDPF